MKTLTIRNLTIKDNEIIEEVKQLTGEKTASKALIRAASDFLLYKKKYQNLERRHFKMIDKLNNK